MESILPGSLVLLYNLGELHQGVVISANRNSAEVQFPDGSVLQLPCARFCLISLLPMDAADAEGSLSRFNSAVREEYNALDPVSIAKKMPSAAGCNWDELCALSEMDSDAKRFALFYLIKDHPELFYRKKELFFSRDEAERASFAETEARQKERIEYLAIAAEIMTRVSSGADLQTLQRDFAPAVLNQFRLELSEILLYNQHPDL
ncbi:MAG: hypothetical protein U1B83_06760, partial [Candidatus Cloacimonadaceae bacterium]|nr:hypothetical protein [Candidatus Cloacimonadaceae bacterium]